ncbi:hypothetical protein [Leifsonia sp. Leaf264]|uniref:hypothetical protein n=1 Tax=Leifsonia sp. Leaf264 TaxID=1736314 RepID=UPI0006FBC0AE|nr:hypothetical protein [Leifsonia sp. Leaf264]KQO98664.1 hypothetical protein ASF30_11420 [Leifsonia sp. Leaf264]
MSNVSSVSNTELHAKVQYYVPRLIIGAVVAVAGVLIFAIITGSWDFLMWRMIGTVAVFASYVAGLWAVSRFTLSRPLWAFATQFAAISFVLFFALWSLWINPTGLADVGWLWAILVAVVAVAHVELVAFNASQQWGKLVGYVSAATYVLIALLAVGLTIPFYSFTASHSEVFWKSVGVIGVLDLLGTVIIPLAWSLLHREEIVRSRTLAWPVFEDGTKLPKLSNGKPDWAAAVAPSRTESGPVGELRRMAWPSYLDGRELAALSDGTPDWPGTR